MSHFNLKEYGFPDDLLNIDDENCSNDEIPARITAVHRGIYEAVCCHGFVQTQLKAGSYYSDENAEFPAVGDYVRLRYNDNGPSLIHDTLPRRTVFTRSDFSGHAVGYVKTIKEQVVAANFDYVFIMVSLNQDFNPKRVERYLIQAWQSGAIPVVVLTKADLIDELDPYLLAISEYTFGVDVVPISALSGQGLERLSAFAAPQKTIVFLGSSGVGKSSLVNALAGTELMKVSAIREEDARGRHTTTHRQLIKLPNGALIIDTPGMRELGMWEAESGLASAFADIEQLFELCRFNDCSHQNEPGCAVQQALRDGTLDPERWYRYLQLKAEARFSDDKSAYLREKDARHKEISRSMRQREKNGMRIKR